MTTEPQSNIEKHIVFLDILQRGELLRSELLRKARPEELKAILELFLNMKKEICQCLQGIHIVLSSQHSPTEIFRCPIINTYRTAVSPTLDLLCHEDFNVGQSEAESNTEIFMAQ